MSILEHLEELRRRLFKIMWVLLPLFIFYVTFSLRQVEFQGFPVPYIWPDFYGSISTQVVRALMDSYLPDFVERVQLQPAEAIIVQFKVAMFLAILTGMPMIVYQLAKFLTPGLYTKEKKTIARITIPATLLFVTGVLFAHFWILPFTFQFLYGVGLRMGLTPLAGPGQFFDMVLLFFLGLGLAFQIPIIMWGLTALGIIEPAVWRKYWRVALVAFFFFGAVITPDGSGITMLLVAVPMTGLYAVGYLISNRSWRRKEGLRERGERRKSRFAVWSVVIVIVVAVAGGLAYSNRALFAPPVEVSDIILTTGSISLHLPAFVLYSPDPFGPDVQTGAIVTIMNETRVSFRWSAVASDGREVGFVADSDFGGSILPGETDSTMIVFPTLWTLADAQSLTVIATDGRSQVYTLELTVGYRLLLRSEFSDRNRNGNMDPGEILMTERLIINYTASAGTASFVDLEESDVKPPPPEQLRLVSKGVFYSAGPSWSLEASIRDVSTSNMTFDYAVEVADAGLEEYGVRLFLTRSYEWSEGEDHRIWLRGASSAQFVYFWNVDIRFGTIYPVLQPL